MLRLHDSFTIDGPNGTHAVHVFNVLGSLHIIARGARTYWNARELCRQVAQGLALLHRNGVVHGGLIFLSRFNIGTDGNGWATDLHMGNIGVAMPQLDEITEEDLIGRSYPPECTIVFPRQTPARPESLPPYLVPPTHISERLLKPTAELHIELLDLGNGMY